MDLDLARDLLLRLASPTQRADTGSVDVAGLDAAKAAEHWQLLEHAGLVAREAQAHRLTVSGREFVKLASNDVLWKRVLGELSGGGRTPTLEAVKARLLEWSFM